MLARSKVLVGLVSAGVFALSFGGPASAEEAPPGHEIPVGTVAEVQPDTNASGHDGSTLDQTESLMQPRSSVYVYSVVNKSVNNANYINTGQLLANCSGSTGTSCAISSTKSATRSISLSLSMSRASVAGALGISSAASQSLAISCTSPKLKAGQVYKAYPRGVRYQYKVTRTQRTWTQAGWVNGPTSTSGWLYAFNPTGIHCTV